MPRRSKVETLPAEIRAWLDRVLAERNFAGYELLAQELARIGHAIGKSSLGRYGQRLQRKLEAIQASTEAAAAIAAAAPDDADLRSAAVMSLVQTEVFDLLVRLREIDDETDPAKRMKIMSAVAGNIAKLSRASVNQKRWEREVREKVQAAAERVSAAARRGGLSQNAVDEIRREILGIAA